MSLLPFLFSKLHFNFLSKNIEKFKNSHIFFYVYNPYS